MVEESVLRSLVKSLDEPGSANESTAAIKAILAQPEQKAPGAAALAGLIGDLKSSSAKQLALSLLQPYSPNVPEIVDVAITMSNDADEGLRQSAANFLAAIPSNVKARARIFELLEDNVVSVRNIAITAVGRMDHAGGPEGAATALYVISDDGLREEALEILDELDSAVKTLQDLGDLSDGQNEIVDKLILPDIEDLKQIFGGEHESFDSVVPERKRSLITLGGLIQTAKAFSMGATGIANVDEAAANLMKAAERLNPVVDAVKDSI